jgi:predicted lactoylglutathione lyase
MFRKFVAVILFAPLSLPGFSQSKLGEVACVYVTSPDLDSSVALYEKIGFPKIASNVFPVPWAQVSDGSLLIMIRKDTAKYVGITYYTTDIEKVASQLEKDGIRFTQKPKESDPIKRYYFRSPDGLNIMLASNLGAFSQPTGITMLSMKPNDFQSADKYPNKQCGAFGEFCHPVTDLNRSIEFWKKLGFQEKTKMSSPYPWAIVSDGLMLIGLHQTKDFAYPAVTYFGLNTEQRVQQLKQSGVTGITEMMGKKNVVLETWEGLHVFLFTMGM